MSERAADSDHAKEEAQRAKSFNGLTAREWTQMSRNVWSDLSSPRNKRHLVHGAVFPVKLADRLIRLYSREGDLVLDPFVGIGSTLIAAWNAGRPSIGIELSPEFSSIANEWIQEESILNDPQIRPKVFTDDARHVASLVEPESVQVIVTSPPYADFIHRSVEDRQRTHKTSLIKHENNSVVRPYSDDHRDLGNLEYGEFLETTEKILHDLLTVVKPGGYAVWVVKDYRMPPDRPYIPFHSDLASSAERVGWLWHDLIIWDQNDQRRLILLGFPSRFYTNQNCSFLVVLRRP